MYIEDELSLILSDLKYHILQIPIVKIWVSYIQIQSLNAVSSIMQVEKEWWHSYKFQRPESDFAVSMFIQLIKCLLVRNYIFEKRVCDNRDENG